MGDEAQEFISGLHGWALLPLPLPARPEWKQHASSRLRMRQKRRLEVWRLTTKLINTINAMDAGHVSTDKLTSPASCQGHHVKLTDARLLAVRHLLGECSAFARVRRNLGLTGVQQAAAVASLLKQSLDEFGYMKYNSVKQVPLEADKIVEPPNDGCIEMLEALPPEDAQFYALEENVVETMGKSDIIFKETEARFGFVGGSEEEYIKYMARADVQHLWEWDLLSNIRAIAGVSAVPKKNQVDQRKLIMQVASNYMFSDPSSRAHLGMFGGAALTRCFVPSDHLEVAICDEDTAFTYVKVPEWMTRWQGGPPVLACKVWQLLPNDLQIQIPEPGTTYVSPRYLRLAMGGSHSVYILMRINLRHIGRGLLNYVNKIAVEDNKVPTPDDIPCACHVHPEDELLPDDLWQERQRLRRSAQTQGASGYTVAEWCQAVRHAQHSHTRVFVVMHFFAGERRAGDIQEHLMNMCRGEGLKLLMVSVDLATDANWDYTSPETFHSIMELVEEGLIDIVIGGPPCSTVSRSRHVPLPGGPRPLRFRSCIWGRPDLKPWEAERVAEANTLWLNYLATCEGVSMRGGAHGWEHPADPEEEPFPSVWALPEMINMETRTHAKRSLFHQCPFGGEAPKITCFSGTLVGIEDLDGIRCPGLSAQHVHGKSIGRKEDGTFHTRRLQQYPSLLCQAFAEMIVKTLKKMLLSRSGPTGALRSEYDVAAPRVPAWSTWAEQRGKGIVLLNEASVRRQNVILSKAQSATYVHVDDTVFLSDASQGPLFCDTVMDEVVAQLEKVGFGVSQKERHDAAEKVVGYEVCRHPACFMLPRKKMVLLSEALKFVASRRLVHVRVLRALVGVWIFGALLRRELLSIPHSVFHFMEEFELQTVKWWKSARQEVLAMARVTCLMYCHVGAPFLKWIFATDAMGANEHDFGGYGMVTTQVSDEELKEITRQGEAEGRALARLDGQGGSKYPERALKPTVPFTRLPSQLFDLNRWHLVDAGRWKFDEHITLGEARTVLKLLRMIATNEEHHDSVIFSLQDNRPTSCSMTKGRSPSFALNRILRQRAAVCLAARLRHFLPWNRWELTEVSSEDIDLLMLEYRTEFDISRSQHVQLLASMEFFIPHLKGKLLLNREAIKGRIAGAPIRHTVPLTAECAYLFAAFHSARGYPRIGAALLIQLGTGLRPSELLSLQHQHVHVPLNPREPVSLRLGVDYSTKVKREQYVLVCPRKNLLTYNMLKLVHAATHTKSRLFPFSYATYNSSFQLAESHYKLNLHMTAHSGRAGFATSRIMSGAEAKQVQAEGRNISQNTLLGWNRCMTRKKSRADSLEPMERPDLRLKENRFLIPQAPDHFTSYQKRQWREEQLNRLVTPSSTEPKLRQPVTPSPGAGATSSKARAKVAASSWQWGGRRSRFSISSWWKWVPTSLKRLSGISLVLCCGLLSGLNGPVHQVARVLGAVADIGEATSAVAVQAINATNALAATASALVSVATYNGLSAGANLWHGIDLADLQASRCAGSVSALNRAALAAWLHTANARMHFPCLDDTLAARLEAAIYAVNADLPSTQSVAEDLKLQGSFASVRISATWHGLDKLTVQFEAYFLWFVPIWSNPLWTQCGFHLDSERDQILAALRLLLLDLPAAPAQRAFQGLELELALAEPVATQWALVLQLWRAVTSRFHGGSGSVDAAGDTTWSTLSWFSSLEWGYFLTSVMLVTMTGLVIGDGFFVNQFLHLDLEPGDSPLRLCLPLPDFEGPEDIEDEEDELEGARHREVHDLLTPPAHVTSVASSPDSSAGTGSFTMLDG
eukprot:Skav210523  [mRNA]  locus=scaffold3045:172599:178253:+ [translate_table: standard]